MKWSAQTRQVLALELRALANAIEATQEPDRIEQHLKEIQAMARWVLRKELHTNSYWITN